MQTQKFSNMYVGLPLAIKNRVSRAIKNEKGRLKVDSEVDESAVP